MKCRSFPLLAALALSTSPSSSPAAEEKPIAVFSGDGLTVAVYFEDEESGEFGGEVTLPSIRSPRHWRTMNRQSPAT